MHDREFEDRLRATLRAEAEHAPLDVDVERLEARLRVRRATRRSSRAGLLAAGVAVVALGVAAAGVNGWLPWQGRVAAPSVACEPVDLAAPFGSDASTWGTVVLEAGDDTRLTGEMQAWGDESGSWAPDVMPRIPKVSALPFDNRTLRVSVADRCLRHVRAEARPYSDSPPAAPRLPGDALVLFDGDVDPAGSTVGFEHPVNGDWLIRVTATFTTTDGGEVWSETLFAIRASGRVESPGPLAGRLPLPEFPTGDLAFDVSSEHDVPTGEAGTVMTQTLGTLPNAPLYELSIVCLGPGELTYRIGGPGAQDPAVSSSVPCDAVPSVPEGATIEADGDQEVSITVDASAAWRVIGATKGSRSGLVLPTRLLVSPWVPPDESVQAVEGCGANLERLPGQRGFGACAASPWLDPGSIPAAVEIVAGQEVSLRLDPGWRIGSLRLQAAPADADYVLGVPSGARLLHEQSAVTDIAVLPIDLDAGAYVLRIDLWGESGTEAFTAAMYVRLEVAE